MTHLECLQDLAKNNGGLLTRRDAVDAGVPDRHLRRLVERGTLARLARGVYAVGSSDVDSPQVITERHKVVLSHASAAAFHGVELSAPVDLVHVTAPRNRGRRCRDITGARLHRSQLAEDEIVVIRGVRVTTPLRTAIDIARSCELDFAVTAIDSFLRAGSFTLAQLAAAAAKARGRASTTTRRACALVDPESGSVFESLTRVLLWQHGVLSPTSQFSLRHRPSGWHGRLDFAWESLRVALECDGRAFHTSQEQFRSDRRRWNALTRLGWQLVVITWFDLTQDPDYVVALIRELLGSETHEHTLPVLAAA